MYYSVQVFVCCLIAALCQHTWLPIIVLSNMYMYIQHVYNIIVFIKMPQLLYQLPRVIIAIVSIRGIPKPASQIPVLVSLYRKYVRCPLA